MENEQIFVRDVMENVVGFEKFMKNYFGLKYEKSFATNEVVEKPLRSKGLISAYDLVDNLASSSDPVNDVDDFIGEYGNLEILSDKYDNTYNYCGYLDRYVNFGIFELENDQVLVTLAVGLGLDPRGGYTDSIAMLFDNEYTFLECLDETFQLMDFEIKVNGKKYLASFDATALSEFGYLKLDDKETGENVYYDEVIMDATDKDDIIENVSEILEVDTDNIEISEINYFWEGN